MKQVVKRKGRHQDEQPEAEAKDVQDEQLDKETEDVLADIDCCLAEAVADLDEKAQAKAEWEKIEKLGAGAVGDQSKLDDYFYARDAWVEKYRYVIKMTVDCCGHIEPDFGD